MSEIIETIIGTESPAIRVNYADGTAVSVAAGDWAAADLAGVRDIADVKWTAEVLATNEAMEAEAQLRFEALENA
jgi:hypothetical protein